MLKRILNWFYPQRSVIFFTDCKDKNAISRVEASLLFLLKNFQIRVYGADSWQEIALSIYNILDIWTQNKSEGNVVVGNFAPRDGAWPNGAPFCFARLNGNLIIGTPQCFSLLVSKNKLNKNRIYQTDVYEVCSQFLPEETASQISRSQFRSLEYVPKLIDWLMRYKNFPISNLDMVPVLSTNEIFFIDNFGNILFLLSAEDFLSIWNNFCKIGQSVLFPVVAKEKLADLNMGELAFVQGSKGCVELILKGGSAASHLNIKLGDKIKFYESDLIDA